MNEPRANELRTERLWLRRWRPSDVDALYKLNNDARVLECLPEPLDREQCEQQLARMEAHFEEHGFGRFAVEVPGVAPCIGFVGLCVVPFEEHFTPAVEIAWRLDADAWGHGYATEAARAVLRFGLQNLQLPSVVSFTVPHNVRSRRVMEKLGLSHDPVDNFEHPALPEGHPLRPHVLYRA